MNSYNITINTHSSIRIEGSRILYIDPFQIKAQPHDADLILITHSHFDHLDPESIAGIVRENTVFVAPESIREEAEKIFAGHAAVFVQPGDEKEAAGIRFRALPAYNKLKPFHPKHNRWVGYLITMDQTSYYIAGDTDAVKELTDLTCDIALVPVGGKYTMTAQEAAKLVNHISPAVAIPTHYGSVVGNGKEGEIFRGLVNKNIKVEILL